MRQLLANTGTLARCGLALAAGLLLTSCAVPAGSLLGGLLLLGGLVTGALSLAACSDRGCRGGGVGPCLSVAPDRRDARVEPCLQRPRPTLDARVGPCFKPRILRRGDAGATHVGPCLSQPRRADAAVRPVGPCLSKPPPRTHVCLSIRRPPKPIKPPPVGPCLSDIPLEPCLKRAPAPGTTSDAGRLELIDQLRADGVLAPELAERLKRLAG